MVFLNYRRRLTRNHWLRHRWGWLGLIVGLVVVIWVGSVSRELLVDQSRTAAGLTTVTIGPASSVATIAAELQTAAVIDRAWLFRTYVRLRGYSSRLPAGQYQLAAHDSVRRLVNQLLVGAGARETAVTLVEGWTAAQYADRLSAALGGEDPSSWRAGFMSALRPQSALDFVRQLPAGVDVEGYLFPDTYRFFNDATATEVVEQLLAAFDRQFTTAMRQAAARQGKTIHEVVTLASIVEREVNTPADRRLAADIFWRRLDAGIALQADSTVNYL
ncbi:MAG: endolytic transglycosylase MltG, partial [Patescibacteria group bacterium]